MCREHLRTVLENLQQIAQGMQKQQQGDPVSMTTFSVSVPVTVAVLVSQQREVLIFQLPSNAAVVPVAVLREPGCIVCSKVIIMVCPGSTPGGTTVCSIAPVGVCTWNAWPGMTSAGTTTSIVARIFANYDRTKDLPPLQRRL